MTDDGPQVDKHLTKTLRKETVGEKQQLQTFYPARSVRYTSSPWPNLYLERLTLHKLLKTSGELAHW